MSDLTELGGVLHEEHFRIIVWVSELKNRVTSKAGDRSIALDDAEERRELGELLVALDDVFRHHSFEEDELFPLLSHRGGKDTADYLTREHAVIEPIIKHLQAIATERLGHRADKGYWSRFRRAVNELYAEVIAHLAREEEVIVQRLRGLLDADTDRRLARQHSAAPLLFGAGAH
jgi:hemerythrin-like domain-containing protein